MQISQRKIQMIQKEWGKFIVRQREVDLTNLIQIFIVSYENAALEKGRGCFVFYGNVASKSKSRKT